MRTSSVSTPPSGHGLGRGPRWLCLLVRLGGMFAPRGVLERVPRACPWGSTTPISSVRRLGSRAALGGVMLLAALLRFSQLPSTGVVMHDDAALMNVAGTLLTSAEIVVRHATDLMSHRWTMADVKEAVHARFGPADVFLRARPGVLFPLLFGASLTRLSAITPSLLMALWSLLTVLGLYLLAREIAGPTVGWMASLMFVLSGMALVYSRNYKMEISLMWFWLTLGTWVYLRSRVSDRPGWLWGSGALLGYAFTCHYGILLSLGLFVVFELAWPGRADRRMSQRLQRVARLIGGMGIPLVFFQLLTCVIQRLWPPFATYWPSVVSILSNQFHHEPQQPDPWFYLSFLWRMDGPVSALWLGIGLGVLLWRWIRQRSFHAFAMLALCCGPVFVLSLSTASIFTVPRSMAVALPFVAVSAAVGCVSMSQLISRWWSRPGWILAVLVVITVMVNLRYLLPIIGWRAGYREAVRYISTHTTAGVADVTDAPIWQFYLRRFMYAPADRHELQQLYESGRIQYLAVGSAAYILTRYPSSLPRQIARHLHEVTDVVADRTPTVVFEHPIAGELIYLAELGHLTRQQFYQLQRDPEIRRIRLYDLAQVFGPRTPTAQDAMPGPRVVHR